MLFYLYGLQQTLIEYCTYDVEKLGQIGVSTIIHTDMRKMLKYNALSSHTHSITNVLPWLKYTYLGPSSYCNIEDYMVVYELMLEGTLSFSIFLLN